MNGSLIFRIIVGSRVQMCIIFGVPFQTLEPLVSDDLDQVIAIAIISLKEAENFHAMFTFLFSVD